MEFTETCLGEKQGYFNGFKYIAIYFMLQNNTHSMSYLSSRDLNLRYASITTQEGYTYPPVEARMIAGNRWNLVPPGFRIRGEFNRYVENVHRRGSYLLFKVAENTSGYVLDIPGYQPFSLSEIPSKLSDTDLTILLGGEVDKKYFPFQGGDCILVGDTIDIASHLPTNTSSSAFFSIGQVMKVSEEIEVVVISMNKENGNLNVEVQYVNTSGGYAKRISERLYIIGNDGFIRNTSPTGPFNIGPVQNVNRNYSFYIPDSLSNIKLVISIWESESALNLLNSFVINLE